MNNFDNIDSQGRNKLASDFDFFFNVASLGLKGINYASFMTQSTHGVAIRPYMGDVTFDESFSDKLFRDVSRYNKIATKYHKLTSLQRRQIDAWFNHEYLKFYPNEIRIAFGIKLCGLSLFTKLAKTPEDLIHLTKNKTCVKLIEEEIQVIKLNLEQAWKC